MATTKPRLPARPGIGDDVEVRKRHGGGFHATVSSVGSFAVVEDGHARQGVVAVLDLGGPTLTGLLHRDDDGRWYAHEDELELADSNREARA